MSDEDYTSQLQAILAASNLSLDKKTTILCSAISHYSPQAQQQADQSANGDFLKILMQLLVTVLPLLLKLLAGGV